MPGPGSGRYTSYTPVDSTLAPSKTRYDSRLALFNNKSAAGKGDIQTDLVTKAKSALEEGKGDLQMFPEGVDMAYGAAPTLADAQQNRVGDPANPYVPDLSSPGAEEGKINVNPLSKSGAGSIDAVGADGIKPNYVLPTSVVDQASDSLGAQSPHLTSRVIGGSPIGQELVMGKSKGSQGG